MKNKTRKVLNIRNRISCAFAKKRRGNLQRFLPYAVVAALSVGLTAHASRVADWTPGTINAANELFGPRSGWLFTMTPSGDTLIGNLEADPRLRQAVQYNALGHELKYTEVTGSQVYKVKTNTYGADGQIIQTEETTFDSSDPDPQQNSIRTTLHAFSYDELGRVASEIEVNHGTGTGIEIVVRNPGRLRFVDSAGNPLVLCRCTNCCSDEPH